MNDATNLKESTPSVDPSPEGVPAKLLITHGPVCSGIMPTPKGPAYHKSLWAVMWGCCEDTVEKHIRASNVTIHRCPGLGWFICECDMYPSIPYGKLSDLPSVRGNPSKKPGESPRKKTNGRKPQDQRRGKRPPAEE